MAAFRAEKRIDVLLDAIIALDESERPDYLVMGGDGPMMPMVKERISNHPWLQEHCKLLGIVENTPGFFASIDYFCLCSDREGTPNVVLEAVACGTPVVATAVGGIPEQVKGLRIENSEWQVAELNQYGLEDATGVLVPKGDGSGMASAILSLLANSEWQRNLSENAAVDARKRFDLNRQVDDYLAWYQEILEGKK